MGTRTSHKWRPSYVGRANCIRPVKHTGKKARMQQSKQLPQASLENWFFGMKAFVALGQTHQPSIAAQLATRCH